MRPPRLVPRAMLERIANELTEWPLAVHREGASNITDALALLVTAGPSDLYAGHYVVQELVKLALRRADETQQTLDPTPPERVRLDRVRDEFVALRRNLALTLDVVDAVLAAIPAGGAA